MIQIEEIAKNAAGTWCRCFKCDGIVNETGLKCKKPNATCRKWYDSYRASKLALHQAEKDRSSERDELTRWNSPYELPALDEDGNARPVLMKFPDGDYGIGFYHDYWSDECDNNVSILGWREIHE